MQTKFFGSQLRYRNVHNNPLLTLKVEKNGEQHTTFLAALLQNELESDVLHNLIPPNYTFVAKKTLLFRVVKRAKFLYDSLSEAMLQNKLHQFFCPFYRNQELYFFAFPFSDGLGFTGVYIAVDIGVKSHEESKTSVVDVFELSKNLRRDRHGIVCSLEHYNFIYQVSGKLKRNRILLLF